MYKEPFFGENTVRCDNMNKDRFSRILKSKGFYLSLLTGVLAIAAICFVCFNMNTDKNKKNGLTDLNGKSITQQTEKDQKKSDDKTTSKEPQDKTVVSDNTKKDTKDKTSKDTTKKSADNDGNVSEKALAEEQQESVAANSKAKKSTLSFDEDATLAWPVKGDIIIPYDIEHGVQFLTLGQYKCSDAIVISAKVGTKVKSAAKAKVVSIKKDEELGTMVTTDIGSGYQITYGQLKNVKVKVGETVKQGAVIGQVAKPTKYYVVEGSNLYFKVTEDNESVNPMYLLD